MTTPADLPIISFISDTEWKKWLEKNHAASQGIWMRIFKKTANEDSIDYDGALDEALCYGWIDGQKKSYDNASWLQRFTPRRPKSVWSKRNTDHVERLTKAGRMTSAGLKEVEAAKQDGRWETAYEGSSTMKLPEDFLKELSRNKKAKIFFESLNRVNRYAIAYRLHNAKKPETREKRMKTFLEMLAKGEKLYT